MAVKDYYKHYEGIASSSSAAQTPNTVSRSHGTGDRSITTVVWQSGKPVLDSELQLGQDVLKWEIDQLRQWEGPSGWLRAATLRDSYQDFVTETAPSGVVDPSGSYILPDRTMVNSFLLPRLMAMVAGRPVAVEFTNTDSAGWNIVSLPEPTIYDGTDGTVKRTDFVFLEVWLALVAPSLPARGVVSFDDNAAIEEGDTITIGTTTFTVVASNPADNEFVVGATSSDTAINFANAVTSSPSLAGSVHTMVDDIAVRLTHVPPGTVGNGTLLATSTANVGSITVSGPSFTGGEDRPNKPFNAQHKLYRHGNVLSPSATWLDDEILNPNLGMESSQRVQVQYRIRSTAAAQGVNYKAHPDGFSNTGSPTFAQAGLTAPVDDYPFVPANKTTVWMNSSAAAYGIEDSGLWVAGNGSEASAQALGTLDGFVYAIPLCFVHRHNDASDPQAAVQGFDPETNANGAPTYQHEGYTGNLGDIPAGVSDRPDGAFCDVIRETNLLDLRRHVMLSGFNPSNELQYQIQSLLDGNNRTWSVDIADRQPMGDDSGDVSTCYLVCDEIGRDEGNPDSTRGQFIREFDHIARRFGAQSVIERVVFAFSPEDSDPGKYVTKAAGPPEWDDQWIEGDALHLDLDQLDASTLGSIFDGGDGGGSSATNLLDPTVGRFMPSGTVITDVLGMWHDDGHPDAAIDQQVQARLITGLGTKHLIVLLDHNPTTAYYGISSDGDHTLVKSPDDVGDTSKSQRRIFVEVEITYPAGVGASCTPDLPVTPDPTLYDGTHAGPGDQRPGAGPQIELDVTTRPTDMQTPRPPLFRPTYREVHLEYVANGADTHGNPTSDPITDTIISRDQTTLFLPRRVQEGSLQVEDLGSGSPAAVDDGETEYGNSSRKVVLSAPLSQAGQTKCEVTYYARDPLPNYGPLGAGYQVAVYYRSAAPQTAGVREGAIGTAAGGVLPTVLNVEPLQMNQSLWTAQVGVGSVDRAYPYALPAHQLPTHDGGDLLKDDFWCATGNLAVADFDSNAGLLTLHPFVQADSQSVFQFGSASKPPISDGEFRAFYRTAADWVYRPTVIAQPLSGASRHKVFFPFLARIVEEVPGAGGGLLFRKNEVVLVVLCRSAMLDEDNSVRFFDDDNTTAASVYRTRNMLLIAGDNYTPVPTP